MESSLLIQPLSSRVRDVIDAVRSGLFDRRFYEQNNPDVPRGMLSSLRHYLSHGGPEGRAPSTAFDSKFYLDEYPDVRAANMNPLLHFVRYGSKEGRFPTLKAKVNSKLSPLLQHLVLAKQNRENAPVKVNLHALFQDNQPERRAVRQLVAEIFLSGSGIEVGALQDPLPVPVQAAVKYVDRFSKTDLFNQYPELRGAPLVDVDIIDNGEQLFSLPAGSQDFIIANHFLEHTQDPIGTLKNFCRVLKRGGYLYMAVPDQTSTFDKDRLPTPLQHVISDHRNGPAASRHGHFQEWVTLCEPHFGRTYSPSDAAVRVKELEDKDYSIHFHCWRPDGFDEFLDYCCREEMIGASLAFFCESPGEILVVLKRT